MAEQAVPIAWEAIGQLRISHPPDQTRHLSQRGENRPLLHSSLPERSGVAGGAPTVFGSGSARLGVRIVNIPVKLFCAIGADAMSEYRIGVIPDVLLYLFPISGIRSNLFAGSTDREKPVQSLDMSEGVLQLRNEPIPFDQEKPLLVSELGDEGAEDSAFG